MRGRARLASDRLPVDDTDAWHVGEGDVLLGGRQVVRVQREPFSRRVEISTDAPDVQVVDHDTPIRVVRRAL